MTDRDRLIELLEGTAHENGGMPSFSDIADYLLANDVLLPVRCKDCKNCELIYPIKAKSEEPKPLYYCSSLDALTKPTDFCSYGELKELNNNAKL